MSGISFSSDEKTGLDEVHADGHIHLEYMDTNSVWIGIDLPNGEVWHITLNAKGKITGDIYQA